MHVTHHNEEAVRQFKLQFGPNYAQSPERRQELWVKFKADFDRKHGVFIIPRFVAHK